VLAGDSRALARAISLVEDEASSGPDLLRALHGKTGNAYLIGVTGPPGAGKSTLVDRLTIEARQEGRQVGVIAVDPTSPFTGGAVLGDRVRMSRHASDSGVFIRSMATRGQLGGIARATSDAAAILDAAGKDLVIVETVGVGQDEIDITRTADVSIVVLVPGAGDEIQALKAGIMEIADIFVVNKADREGVDRLVQAIAANQALQTYAPGEWKPPILKTVATTGDGVAAVWNAAAEFRVRSAKSSERRRAREEHRLRERLSQQFFQQLEKVMGPGELGRTVERMTKGEIDPYSAADDIMERYVERVLQRPRDQTQGDAGRVPHGMDEQARADPPKQP
jgi:LAO/AO transport system kinase